MQKREARIYLRGPGCVGGHAAVSHARFRCDIATTRSCLAAREAGCCTSQARWSYLTYFFKRKRHCCVGGKPPWPSVRPAGACRLPGGCARLSEAAHRTANRWLLLGPFNPLKLWALYLQTQPLVRLLSVSDRRKAQEISADGRMAVTFSRPENMLGASSV